MKNIVLHFLLASCFQFAFAQDDSIDVKLAPTLTEIGKPIGEKVTQQIDRDGGRIVSADKNLELIVPRDALSKQTEISIQLVENTLSPGSHNSYHLEPSGISFQKPLQIIFHYSSKEDAAVPELRDIAWQDEKGQWSVLDSSVVDTTARTVTGNITHFSYWAFFDYFNLKPAEGRVKVGKMIPLQITCIYPGGLSDNFKTNMLKKIKFVSYVNGIRKGNAEVGTISSAAGLTEDRFLNYNAPSNVPDNNPVAISVEASNISFNRNTYSKIKLVSNIVIYDKAYEIRVKGYNEQSILGCTVKSIDSSSCTVVLKGKHSTLGDIQNMDVNITASKCQCPVTELNAGHNIGVINIEGATKIEVMPANPPGKPFREIRVYFIRSAGWLPGFHAPPCGHTNDVVTPPMAMYALPNYLTWDDDDIQHSFVGGNSKNGFEIKIIPVKEK